MPQVTGNPNEDDSDLEGFERVEKQMEDEAEEVGRFFIFSCIFHINLSLIINLL